MTKGAAEGRGKGGGGYFKMVLLQIRILGFAGAMKLISWYKFSIVNQMK